MSCSSVEPAAQRACTSANTNTWVNALYDNIQAATVLLELSSCITILWDHCHHYSVHCCSKHHCVAHPCLLRIGSLSDNLVSETQQAAGKESCSLSKFPSLFTLLRAHPVVAGSSTLAHKWLRTSFTFWVHTKRIHSSWYSTNGASAIQTALPPPKNCLLSSTAKVQACQSGKKSCKHKIKHL